MTPEERLRAPMPTLCPACVGAKQWDRKTGALVFTPFPDTLRPAGLVKCMVCAGTGRVALNGVEHG